MTMRWMDILVVGVYTQQTTQSPILVAVMLFARLAPSLFFGAFAGVLAERFSPKTLLTLGLSIATSVSCALYVLAAMDVIELWHIGVGAFLSGTFWALEYPTRRVILGEIAGMERLGSAMSLDTATNHASRMVGPALGGYLLQTNGLAGPLMFGIFLYGAATLNIFMLKLAKPIGITKSESFPSSIRAGLHYIRSNRIISATLAITVAVNFFGFSYAAMVPVIGEMKYQLNALEIGILASMEGIGALVGALLIAFLTPPRWFPRVYTLGSLLFLLMILCFSISSNHLLSLAILLLAGGGIAGFSAMQSSLIFAASDPQYRRRVMGILVVCIGAGPLGVLHTGLLTTWLSADLAIMVIALEGLTVVCFALKIWPELYRPAINLYTDREVT